MREGEANPSRQIQYQIDQGVHASIVEIGMIGCQAMFRVQPWASTQSGLGRRISGGEAQCQERLMVLVKAPNDLLIFAAITP